MRKRCDVIYETVQRYDQFRKEIDNFTNKAVDSLRLLPNDDEKCKVSFLQIKEILCLPWGQFINLTDEKYSRYLLKRKRYRINQNDEFHTAILPELLA